MLPPSSYLLPHALAVLLLAAIFYRTAAAPIGLIETWGRWALGRWIVQHGHLPEREPLTPFSSQDQPFLDTAWLSEVVGYKVYAAAGLEGIILFFSLVEVLKFALYLVAFRRAADSWILGFLGVLLLLVARWDNPPFHQPLALAELCLAAMLAVLGTGVAVFIVPILAALWANLHGSFLLAFLILSLLLADTFLAQWRQSRSLSLALQRPAVGRLTLALVLSLAAVCVNPHGSSLVTAVVGNLDPFRIGLDRAGRPLTPLHSYDSIALIVSYVLVLLTVRWSPRRFDAGTICLLMLSGVATWFFAGVVFWWFPIGLFFLLPHWRAMLCLTQMTEHPALHRLQVLLRKHAVLVVVSSCSTAVILVVTSASGRWLLMQQSRPVEAMVSAETPLRAAQALKDAPGGPIRLFASSAWSDYFLWELQPPSSVFWYNRWEAFSVDHIADGARLATLAPSLSAWHHLLERYQLNALAVRTTGATRSLAEYLLEQEGPASAWAILYRGPDGVVAMRCPDRHSLSLRLHNRSSWGFRTTDVHHR